MFKLFKLWLRLDKRRKRMVDKTVNDLRAEVVSLKEENKKLKQDNSRLRTTLREERLKKKEWHHRYIKLRERLDELK